MSKLIKWWPVTAGATISFLVCHFMYYYGNKCSVQNSNWKQYCGGAKWFSVLIDRFFGMEADAWVALFTMLLFVSTTGLWFYTALLWRDAKDQRADNREAISASVRSAKAAQQSADALTVIESAFIREVIAPVNIYAAFGNPLFDNSLSMGPTKCQIGIELYFQNFGKTPAEILAYGWDIDIAARQHIIEVDPPVLPKQFTLIEATVPANSISENVGYIEERKISSTDSYALVRKQKYIWAHGWVQYRDVFDRTRTQYFVWRYDRQRDAFSPCDPYAK